MDEGDDRDYEYAYNAVASGVDSLLPGLPAATVMALGAPLSNDPTPLVLRENYAQPGGGDAPPDLASESAARRRQHQPEPAHGSPLMETSVKEWCLEHARVMSLWPGKPNNWWEQFGEDSKYDEDSDPESDRELYHEDAIVVSEFAAEWRRITGENEQHRIHRRILPVWIHAGTLPSETSWKKCVYIQKSFASRHVLERLVLVFALRGMFENVCVLYCCLFSVMRF